MKTERTSKLFIALLCTVAIISPSATAQISSPTPPPAFQSTLSPSPTPSPQVEPAASPTPATPETPPSPAEPEASPSAVVQTVDKPELHQALLDLTNPWTVMCVAAHPDDEDGTTLTVLRRRDGAHTVSLFSTFGEGGQNAVGPELYEELGVIRVNETTKAAEIQGSEPHFLGLKDFGFSKSADEAFKVWGHDEALRRMVLKIRELRPDVIITNHNTTSGHGHHQATGRLIIEAFDAAADPQKFPEQLGQLKPWQAQRLFVRVVMTRVRVVTEGRRPPTRTEEPPEKSFAIDPNEVDPIRGTSFAEQALTALQQHASQGPWPKSIAELQKRLGVEVAKLPLIRYQIVREATGAPALPANANTPWAGLQLSEAFAATNAAPQIDGRPLTDFLDRLDRVLAALVDWRASQTNEASPDNDPARDLVRGRLLATRADRALALASGVSLKLSSPASALVPGVPATFSIELANPGAREIHVGNLRLSSWGPTTNIKTADLLIPDTETVITAETVTPKNTPLTVPQEEHLYDGLFTGKRFVAVADLEIDGAKFSVETEIARPVAPAVEIRKISPAVLVWTPGRKDQGISFTALVTNNMATPFRGVLALSSSALGISAVGTNLSLAGNESRSVELKSPANPLAKPRGRAATANPNHAFLIVEDSAATAIAKRAVPVVFSDARVVSGLRVGYVPSFDDTLKHSLAALGVNAKALEAAAVQNSELSNFDTIIIDNRGYEAHPELIAANSRLLDFVSAGGTLIVFYHKTNEWNPDPNKNRPQLAPFPITIGEERVTDETAPITFLASRHPLLSLPNRITQSDFANWIQERGLNYPKEWDNKYTALFATNDPGEAVLKSGLLTAPHGKGHYIYTSMVWYRQLRGGVPGAYRMFANMISYGHK